MEVKSNKKDKKVEIWEPVGSYYDIVNDARCGSMRCILQGDAGYGKSTLTLQLAYEWCDKRTSPLADFEILVLLNLRQLGSTSSIFKAIRQFLLPKDTGLTENDIRTIFHNTLSVLIILDGYDEYSVQEQETDITLIIKRDILQEVPIILTTRSSCLPDNFPSNTQHFRLNGFNESARERYIDKVVVGDNAEAAKRIKQCLVENPVLCDLCQVPLFFVMFAHMTFERCAVLWNPVGTWYNWNTSTHLWEDRYKDIFMTPEKYDTEVHKFRKEWSFTHWQGCTNNDNNQTNAIEKPPPL
ncbi:NLR family CARD domain-containing protein 4 [Holothuria leucospilota]|uniref:NLR family CARD domain-containing protein 4 n=1 Tax=Holothuria leucospilota TaxID=206669 RepID=A0A9Q1H6G4_HOLLE|nr:NLR family CARD domain-containing protein 4 [Holothuria leucospilota]